MSSKNWPVSAAIPVLVREHAKGIAAADLKEFWQVGQPAPAYNGPEYHDNISVNERPELAPTFRQCLPAVRAHWYGVTQCYCNVI